MGMFSCDLPAFPSLFVIKNDLSNRKIQSPKSRFISARVFGGWIFLLDNLFLAITLTSQVRHMGPSQFFLFGKSFLIRKREGGAGKSQENIRKSAGRTKQM